MRVVLSLLVGLCSLAFWWPAAGLAQPFYASPTYFSVDGVTSDDVLNIRANPNAAAEIVGSLAHDARPVEAVRIESGWAYVSTGEGMGWASTAYLREIDVSKIADSSLPDGLVCSGTEPFWGLTASSAGISFSGMDMAETNLNLTDVSGFAGVGQIKSFLVAEGGGQSIAGIVSDEMCSDGMSNRTYPRRIDLILYQPGGPVGYTGCCSLPLN